MKRLFVLGVLVAIVIATVSSHTNANTTTSAASEPVATVPVAGKPKHHASPHVRYTSCDQNISVGPATTCGFADNVFRAYARRINSEGAGEYTVEASSPATGKTYAMSCHTGSETTLCTGGHSARVRFPLTAAESYYPAPSSASPEQSYDEPEAESGGESEDETGGEAPECTNGTYVNSSGNTVCSPEESSSGPPTGATAECEDGTYSFSEHRSGTCSSHGGVAKWLE
jgi:uncharacterized protein (DUF2147 family)